MNIEIGSGAPSKFDTPLLVLPWCQGPDREAERPPAELDLLDELLGLTLTRAVAGGDFSARFGEMLLLYRLKDRGPDRVLLVGLGQRGDLSAERVRQVAGQAARRALGKALDWNPEKIIIAHGTWVRSNGRKVLEHSLRWLKPQKLGSSAR